MNASINAYIHILKQPVYETRRRAQAWACWGLMVIALAATIPCFVLATKSGDWNIAIFGLAGAMFIVAVMWLGIFLANLAQQNTPSNARLVPQLRRRLVTASAMLWLLFSGSLSGLIALAVGNFGLWLVVAGAALLYIMAIRALPWLVFFPG